MKKGIAILLMVLVAGVMFGSEGGINTGAAVMTLEAKVSGKMYHGFTSAKQTGVLAPSTIRAIPVEYNSTVVLDLESGAYPTTVGYYTMLTTGSANVKVEFTATALYNGTDTYVPYKVAIGTGGNVSTTGVTLSGNVIDLGIAGGPKTVDTSFVVPAVRTKVMLQTSDTGKRYASVPVDVTIGVDENADYGLTEGTYTGTITANFISIS